MLADKVLDMVSIIAWAPLSMWKSSKEILVNCCPPFTSPEPSYRSP